MLNGALILIAEDQPFIALDFSYAVQDAGGRVAGPVATTRDALLLIEAGGIQGAILDFNLTDGDATPIVAKLSEENIPMLIQTGVGLSHDLFSAFPGVKVFVKPNDADLLVKYIFDSIETARRTTGD